MGSVSMASGERRERWFSLDSPFSPLAIAILIPLLKVGQILRDWGGRYVSLPSHWAATPGIMMVWIGWGAWTPLIFVLARRYPPTRPRNVAIHLAAFFVMAFPLELAYWFVLDPRYRADIPLLPHQFFRYSTALGIYAAIAAAGWLHERYLQRSRCIRQALALQQELTRTQLTAVRLQIDPLLVASTLEEIERTVHDDPDRAERLIVTLGDFLRATVEQIDYGQLPLPRDLDRVRAFVELLPIAAGRAVTLDCAAVDAADPHTLSTPDDLVATARELFDAGASELRLALHDGDAAMLLTTNDGVARALPVAPFARGEQAAASEETVAIPPRNALSVRGIAILILLASAFTRFVSYLGESPRDSAPLREALFWVGVSSMITAIGCGVAILIARPIALRIRSAGMQFVLLVVATFAVAFAGELAFGLLYPHWLELNFRPAMKNIFYTVARTRSLLAAHLLFIVTSFSALAMRQNEEELDVSALRMRVRQAQLRKLRNQLRPHFLFNALNSIVGRIGRDRAAARDMTARLRRFLATTLELEPEALVPLSEELAAVENYLSIERNRLGDRMRVIVDAAPNALTTRVPALLLQPVVENAVVHGIAPVSRTVTLQISVKRAKRELLIAVADDGNGPGDTSREGIGLATTRALLQAIYGNAARVTFGGVKGAGFEVRISIPARPSV